MIRKVIVARGLALAALLAFGPLSTTADASSILLNGSFETPVVPAGGYTLFPIGSSAIDGWTVIGNHQDVAIVSGTATGVSGMAGGPAYQAGLTYSAQGGAQWLDLTGSVDWTLSGGVQQTVATTIGNSYLLSFWVGNIFDPYLFVSSSTVRVDINGAVAGYFSNAAIFNSNLEWQQFFLPFVATSGLTTVAFINKDGWNDQTNGLDNVSLEAAGPTVVPEPASLLLFGTGLVFSARRWRKRQPKVA
jgi:hypothetical protein